MLGRLLTLAKSQAALAGLRRHGRLGHPTAFSRPPMQHPAPGGKLDTLVRKVVPALVSSVLPIFYIGKGKRKRNKHTYFFTMISLVALLLGLAAGFWALLSLVGSIQTALWVLLWLALISFCSFVLQGGARQDSAIKILIDADDLRSRSAQDTQAAMKQIRASQVLRPGVPTLVLGMITAVMLLLTSMSTDAQGSRTQLTLRIPTPCEFTLTDEELEYSACDLEQRCSSATVGASSRNLGFFSFVWDHVKHDIASLETEDIARCITDDRFVTGVDLWLIQLRTICKPGFEVKDIDGDKVCKLSERTTSAKVTRTIDNNFYFFNRPPLFLVSEAFSSIEKGVLLDDQSLPVIVCPFSILEPKCHYAIDMGHRLVWGR